MATKRYGYQDFDMGNGISVRCFTTDTRNGFCHHAETYHDGAWYSARVSYCNRTWEAFEYQSVLVSLANRFRKADREKIMARIKGIEDETRRRVEERFQRFKELHEALTPKQKEFLAANVPHIETEGQAKAVEGVMAAMAVFGE